MRTRLLLLISLSLGSCSKAAGVEHKSKAADRGALVARIGQVELREEDVRRAMSRDPGASPERFQNPAARRELIDGLIRFELLVQAAERAGLTRDPDAIHALQQIAVTKLVNQTLGSIGSPETITNADVERDYFTHQKSDFTLPPAAQVRHIRVADAKLADRLAAQARALGPADDRGFASLAAASSEDTATRAAGGDLGFVDPSSHLPRALLDAILSLKTPGEVAGPLPTEGGYEIVRLVQLRAAAVSPLSSVAEPIRQRLYRERRAKALDELVTRLRSESKVELMEPEPSKLSP